jgi:hypothetical protein
MYKFLLFISILSMSFGLQAQTYVELSCGAGYSQQAYYRLADDQTTKLANGSWDLAFTAAGFQDGGILINESTSSSFTDPQPELAVYLAPVAEFTDPIDILSLEMRLYNDEQNWLLGGALNSVRNPANPFDFGWGIYNPTINKVVGYSIYVLKLRNETYKKLMVDSIVLTTYHLKWANLDGSDLQTFTIDKSQHFAAGFAYLSVQNNALVTPAPIGWDFMWGRYNTPTPDGQGGFLDYNVTGILSGPGVSVAVADGVDPYEVDYVAGNYKDSLSTVLTAIGSEWKVFDFAMGWIVNADRAYFVKTKDNRVWRMVIEDFEGISTGNMVFTKTDLGVMTSLKSQSLNDAPISVGPNPIRAGGELMIDWSGAPVQGMMALYDLQGRRVWEYITLFQQGFQVAASLPMGLPAGSYVLQVNVAGQLFAQPWIIQN